jgi:hypothetical protein
MFLLVPPFQVWRQPVANRSSYKYKVFGSFTDISPRDFFVVQMDVDYRKEWDRLIVQLETVDRERGSKNLYSDFLSKPTHSHFDSGNEVIQWIMHYPVKRFSLIQSKKS